MMYVSLGFGTGGLAVIGAFYVYGMFYPPTVILPTTAYLIAFLIWIFEE
jgi:hypothetical protein